jgi:predicted RNA-binding protein YlxR (DUF448 family)
VVRRPDGSLAVGRALPGRGAWLCAESERCFDLARRRRSIGRALRAPVEPAAEAELQRWFSEAPDVRT